MQASILLPHSMNHFRNFTTSIILLWKYLQHNKYRNFPNESFGGSFVCWKSMFILPVDNQMLHTVRTLEICMILLRPSSYKWLYNHSALVAELFFLCCISPYSQISAIFNVSGLKFSKYDLWNFIGQLYPMN